MRNEFGAGVGVEVHWDKNHISLPRNHVIAIIKMFTIPKERTTSLEDICHCIGIHI
jgi:hypothetical protein